MTADDAYALTRVEAVTDDCPEDDEGDRPTYDGIEALTADASNRVARLKELAAESRDLWEQVGKDVARMRELAPRHAVTRQLWLTTIGLGAYRRAAQVSAIVKWGTERQSIEGVLVISPFAATAQSIVALYWKVAGKPKRVTREDDEPHLPENPYSVRELDFVHGRQLDKAVSDRMKDAHRRGAGEVEAAQYALAFAQAEAQKAHAALVVAVRRERGDDEADADGDF